MSAELPWSEHFGRDPVDRAERLTAAVADALAFASDVEDRPRSPLPPGALAARLAELEVCSPDGEPLRDVLRSLGADVWAHGLRPEHVDAAAHLHVPTLIPSVATELVIGATNQSMDSWDQAPAATTVELRLLAWLAGVLGLGDAAGGVMTPGGTASNLLGLTLARSHEAARHGVDVLRDGLPPAAVDWRIVTSVEAHFSVARAASLLGLGRDRVVTVDVDETGAMDPAALDQALESLAGAGLRPMAIVATAGTTDLGAVDPLAAVGERARDAGCWFHVDAAVGGALALSDHHRSLLVGIDGADSVTVDFHKLWWQPISASALLVADADRFDLLRVRSAYLDRGDEPAGVVNLVGRSLDTSRRFDAVKVVAALRAVGLSTMGAMVDHVMALAEAAADEVEATPGLALAAPASTVMVAVRVPGAGADELRAVQQRLLHEGEAVLGRSTVAGVPLLKLTFVNPLATEDDARALVRLLARELGAPGVGPGR